MNFTPGREYTRSDIYDALGGSKVSCLPTVKGQIVAACLSSAFSPAAPAVVLCGQGKRTAPVSKALTLHKGLLPVFLKRGAGRWAFSGQFDVVDSFSAGVEFERFVKGSGRSLASVSFVVLLRRVV